MIAVWDRITSEEATLLVAGYLAEPKRSDIRKAQLPAAFPLVKPSEPRPYPSQELPGSSGRSKGGWTFAGDDNAATHLIRNSLAGDDRGARAELLSLTGKMTRSWRDDCTVT